MMKKVEFATWTYHRPVGKRRVGHRIRHHLEDGHKSEQSLARTVGFVPLECLVAIILSILAPVAGRSCPKFQYPILAHSCLVSLTSIFSCIPVGVLK